MDYAFLLTLLVLTGMPVPRALAAVGLTVQLVFGVLRLCGVIQWRWFYVAMPSLVLAVLLVVGFVVVWVLLDSHQL